MAISVRGWRAGNGGKSGKVGLLGHCYNDTREREGPRWEQCGPGRIRGREKLPLAWTEKFIFKETQLSLPVLEKSGRFLPAYTNFVVNCESWIVNCESGGLYAIFLWFWISQKKTIKTSAQKYISHFSFCESWLPKLQKCHLIHNLQSTIHNSQQNFSTKVHFSLLILWILIAKIAKMPPDSQFTIHDSQFTTKLV